jgi:hypothetical protein
MLYDLFGMHLVCMGRIGRRYGPLSTEQQPAPMTAAWRDAWLAVIKCCILASPQPTLVTTACMTRSRGSHVTVDAPMTCCIVAQLHCHAAGRSWLNPWSNCMGPLRLSAPFSPSVLSLSLPLLVPHKAHLSGLCTHRHLIAHRWSARHRCKSTRLQGRRTTKNGPCVNFASMGICTVCHYIPLPALLPTKGSAFRSSC